MKRTFNIAVNLTKNAYSEFELHPPINLVSGDYGTNVLKFTVYEDGVPVDLTGTIGKLTCKCPSGTHQQQDLTMSSPKEGKMEAILEQRFFAEGGTYLVEVQLYNASDLKVRATLPRFTYNVDLSLLEDKAVIASEQYSILQQMIDNVANAEATSIEALETATRAMNIANQKGDKATIEADRAKSEADRAKTEADRAWSADFSKHVTLDGDKQQNFDFIENKVVQDGLVKIIKDISQTVIAVDVSAYDVVTVLISGVWGKERVSGRFSNILACPVENYGHAYIGVSKDNNAIEANYVGDKQPHFSISFENFFYNHHDIAITWDNISRKISLIIDGVERVTTTNGKPNKLLQVKPFDDYANQDTYKFNGALIYNRKLTSQEIQHDFHVINTAGSIKELSTTDSTGKTSILKLASDEDHVEMASGRTLREEYMGVLNMFGEEFVSSGGSPVEVNNGIEARIISGEIKGHTVKNMTKGGEGFKDLYIGGGNERYTLSWLQKCEVGKPYTIVYEVTKSSVNVGDRIQMTGVIDGVHKVLPHTVGLHCVNVTPNSVQDFVFLTLVTKTDSTITIGNIMILEGTISSIGKGYFDGLGSTKAIMNNNGQQYPIYEPTIQGKTRILKAPKGTQNWVEIDAGEARDKTKFSYKLDSVGGDLGNLYNLHDSVDIARKVKVINTKEIVLDGSESWKLGVINSNGFANFYFSIIDIVENTKDVLCDYYTLDNNLIANVVREGFLVGGTYFYIRIKDSAITTADQFKAYLAQQKQNGTPITIRYRLAKPIEVLLGEEELKAYDAYKKVISLGGVGEVYDTLEIKEDGSGVWVDNIFKEKIKFDTPKLYHSAGGCYVENAVTYNLKSDNAFNCLNFEPVFLDDIQYGRKTGSVLLSNKTLYVYINGFSTLEEYIDYFNKNDIIFEYQLANPTTTHIPKEAMPPIRTHKTNTLSAGGAIKPSGFKVKVPVDKISDIESRLQALESTTVDIVLNKQ